MLGQGAFENCQLGIGTHRNDIRPRNHHVVGGGFPEPEHVGDQHPFLPVEAIYIDDPDGNEVELVTRT